MEGSGINFKGQIITSRRYRVSRFYIINEVRSVNHLFFLKKYGFYYFYKEGLNQTHREELSKVWGKLTCVCLCVCPARGTWGQYADTPRANKVCRNYTIFYIFQVLFYGTKFALQIFLFFKKIIEGEEKVYYTTFLYIFSNFTILFFYL